MTRKELVDLAIEKLGNQYKASDEKVINNIGDTVIGEALNVSHRPETEDTLSDLKAIIIESIIIAYQNRGSESLKSQSELGQSNSFIDWSEYLATNIINRGKRFLYWD